MVSLLLLPDPTVLALVNVEVNEEANLITATAQTTSREAKCPLCQQLAQRVHSKYVRILADLPCSVLGSESAGSFKCVVSGVRIQHASE